MARPAPRIALIAGGSGTRFWPLGRRARPKQVLSLDGKDPRSLLRATLDRVDPVTDATPWIVAPRRLLPMLRRHLDDLPASAFLGEPEARNTAAAILLAAHVCHRQSPDAPLLIVPADHHVSPLGRYRSALKAMASRAARSGAILTLGLAPTRAATGYGYLELGAERERKAVGPIHAVKRFVEKPSVSRAQRMWKGGRHLWNGGTFAFLPEVLLEEARRVLPEVAEPLDRAFDAYGTRGQARALATAFRRVPSISVDYGIMERTRLVETLAVELDWDDLGSWDAVGRHRKADADGNQVRGDATLVGAKGCLVDAQDGHVALLGVEDLIVVRTRDTVLVARRGRGESVKQVVERLADEGRDGLL